MYKDSVVFFGGVNGRRFLGEGGKFLRKLRCFVSVGVGGGAMENNLVISTESII